MLLQLRLVWLNLLLAHLKPNAKTVAGYQSIMPTYQGQISEANLLQIVACLKTLEK